MKIHKPSTLIKSKTMNFIIPLVVYPFDVMVSIGETDDELFTRLKKFDISEDELENIKYEVNGLARYCMFTTGQSIIRLRSLKTPKEYATLQHEIFHVVSTFMWRIGMKLKIKTSCEAYAYLIGYLTEKIYERINHVTQVSKMVLTNKKKRTKITHQK